MSEKVEYYILYDDARGVEKEKIYKTKKGYENALTKMGDSVIEHGVNDETRHEKAKENRKSPLLGSIDSEHSRMQTERLTKIVQSNFNPKTKTYTSRIYSSLTGRNSVIEPDGSVSLEGKDIVKSDKNGILTLTDGRKFYRDGWPVVEE